MSNLLLEALMEEIIPELQTTAFEYYQRGWCLGTSGNFSRVAAKDPLLLLMTASGKDKGRLLKDDFLIVNEAGAPLGDPGVARPSSETPLHLAIVRATRAMAVLHTHSVWSTLLSDKFFGRGVITISGYEMLKGLEGINTHETSIDVPIFDNMQDLSRLAGRVGEMLQSSDPTRLHAFLVRKHGLYTWGKSLSDARRHVEILEFLLEVIARGAS